MKIVGCKVPEEIYEEILKRGTVTDVLRDAIIRYLSNEKIGETSVGWKILANIYGMDKGVVNQLSVNLPNENGNEIIFNRYETVIKAIDKQIETKDVIKRKKKYKIKNSFENKYTKKANEVGYVVAFDKRIIRDISLKLNNYYENNISLDKLKKIISDILISYNHKVYKTKMDGYLFYFRESGLIQRQQGKVGDKFYYKIIRDNTIPKDNKEESLGILNELNL